MAANTKSTGSLDPQIVLMSQRSGPRWKRVVSGIVITVVISVMALGGGYYLGIQEQIEALTERTALRTVTADLKQQLNALEEQTAIHKHGSELERQASERVRQENIQLQNRVSELEEAVVFYKSIMAPSDNDTGLRIKRLDVTATFNQQRFRYKVVMTQVADNSSYISGLIKMNLMGVRAGIKESIPFERLSGDIDSNGSAFKFRYFQDVGGEITIPEDFIPEQIEVIAQSKGRKATRLEKRFDWNVQEVTSDVGKG